MSKQLLVLADGRRMGHVEAKGQRLTFIYDAEWLSSPNPYPLSLSMPLVVPKHGHRVVEAFLWGLLPQVPQFARGECVGNGRTALFHPLSAPLERPRTKSFMVKRKMMMIGRLAMKKAAMIWPHCLTYSPSR